MKKILTSFFFFFVVYNLYSQDIEIIRTGTGKLPRVKWKDNFSLLEKSIDTTSLVFIATYKVSGKVSKLNIIDHFYLIEEKAKRLGANAYILDGHYWDSTNKMATTIISTYFANDTVLMANEKRKPKNIIYIFGDDRVFLKK